ncbi:elongator complex protein 5 isoform X2 [Xenopus laevis]|uniref:Elongator complex protein 5 n=1 Tax=Xenopus laevis TaxID=8355 RepID=A0A8J0U3H1_XENLA|nr:elongator complex protein 5 isoform X2 [Xenopus laevis]
MLQELRSGGAQGLVLISDTVAHSGRELLHSFILAALERGEQVHVMGYELSQEDFLLGFPAHLVSRLHFHDGHSDPLQWIGGPHSLGPLDFTAERIQALLRDSVSMVTVVVDSLSWIMARSPLASICRTLRDLSQGHKRAVPRVLALLHKDLHSPGVVRSVNLLADTVINMEWRGDWDRITVSHCKKSRKIVTSEEMVRILGDLSLEVLREKQMEQRKAQEVDPTANLTFNLRLSDAEREVKDSAILPFTFSDRKKSSLLQSGPGSARVYYEPDPADEDDEEDPDDDLDV